MKKTFGFLLVVATLSLQVLAQPTNFIKGNIDITYNSRKSGPVKGVKDVYTLNINVCNSAQFHGTITDTPQIMEGYFSKSVTQPRSLNYDIACDVMNPKNPAQTRNVGRMFGVVPIAPDGVYYYDKGTLEIAVLPIGNAGGFNSKFTGTAQGKPMGRPANWLDTVKLNAVSITRSVNGKTTTVTLRKYDRMIFNQHTIGAGPVHLYQSVLVNGELLYDYDKDCWFFNNVTMQYAVNGSVKIDRLSGTIRWVKDKNYKANGESEYQFDVRVNEPPPSEASAFSQNVTDESAFFEVDNSIPALVGTMKYKDQIVNETTLASRVAIDLVGNNLTKQHMMGLGKVLIFSAVVPMNSD